MAIGSRKSGRGFEKLIRPESIDTEDRVSMRETAKADAMAFMEGADVERESLDKQELISYVKEKFTRAKDARWNDEQRWLMCYRNFRGIYGPEVMFSAREKNKSFIKITKTKVMAAHNKIVEVLFSGNKFPIGVEASQIPMGIADKVYVDPKEPQANAGGAGPGGTGGAPPQPGVSATTARPDIAKNYGPVTKLLDPVKDKVKDGPGQTPTSMTWEPAKLAAKKMEKKFSDQLSETNADKTLRKFAFELPLFGSGVYKGPMIRDKEYPRWDAAGKYTPETKRVADFTDVSIWDSYPDPQARHTEEMEDFTQRHQLSRTEMRALKTRPGFRKESIELAIKSGPNYVRQYWEDELRDFKNDVPNERWEVLEFWGVVDKELAERAGIEIPKEYDGLDQVQINAWICGGYLLRMIFNTFTPARIPYFIVPCEINPYSIFGIGVAENMTDTQLLMNGFVRGMVDNGTMSANVILEIDETNLVPGQDLEVYPGKIFRRQGGQPGQAITAINIPSVTQEYIMMFDKVRQLADEATGIPSYSHGQGGVQGIGRTASGMSMLMGAADVQIKGIIRNIDDYLLVPMGKALFAFNMQFDFDADFVGDLEVVARGTESLMRNEVRSQKLLQFMQLTNNPTDAPWVKRDYILRELAESLDLEADLVVNDPRTAGLQAMQMQELMKAQGIDPNGGQGGQQAQGAQAQGGNPSGAPSVNDPTQQGGGNIGPGASPTPGEKGFSSPTQSRQAA